MSWGIVTTAKATIADLALFAAHHIGLGCSELHLYLDAPPEGIEALTHPAIKVSPGTQAHEALHRRQMANAQDAYKKAEASWLAHIDVDEFLLPDRPLQAQLDAIPEAHDWARVLPIEALTPATACPCHFKIAPQFAGQPRSVLEALYPEYGLHLRSGYLSHVEGKPFVRTGLQNARLGIHKLLGDNISKPLILEQTKLAHFHATTWQAFSNELPRRLADTSYVSARRDQASIAELIELIQNTDTVDGLHAFFCALTSSDASHLSALRAHNMLLTVNLQLANKARTMFPLAMESIPE